MLYTNRFWCFQWWCTAAYPALEPEQQSWQWPVRYMADNRLSYQSIYCQRTAPESAHDLRFWFLRRTSRRNEKVGTILRRRCRLSRLPKNLSDDCGCLQEFFVYRVECLANRFLSILRFSHMLVARLVMWFVIIPLQTHDTRVWFSKFKELFWYKCVRYWRGYYFSL